MYKIILYAVVAVIGIGAVGGGIYDEGLRF